MHNVTPKNKNKNNNNKKKKNSGETITHAATAHD